MANQVWGAESASGFVSEVGSVWMVEYVTVWQVRSQTTVQVGCMRAKLGCMHVQRL